MQWSSHSENEATWEQEDFLNSKYPDFMNMHQGTSHLTLFSTLHLRRKSRDEISFRGKDCNTRVLNLGINQLMSDLILRLRIESEINPSSVFELGSRGKLEPPDLDPELPEISGYSGISPGYSGPGSLYHTF